MQRIRVAPFVHRVLKMPRGLYKRLFVYTNIGDKNFFRLLQLLIIPIVIVIVAPIVALSLQNANEQLERDIALDNQRQEAMMTYFGRMETLLLDYGLRESNLTSEVAMTARTRTLSVLRVLDIDRKRHVLQFLYEAELISNENTIVRLSDANLEGAYLSRADLRGANLQETDLEWAYLERVDLRGADLQDADLEDAILTGANLEEANLIGANLEEAYLDEAHLGGANLEEANLERAYFVLANLEGANLNRTQLNGAELEDADLEDADLIGANLKGAELERVYLVSANLEGANLEGAYLEGVNLEGANLEATDFVEAYLYGADLDGANLTNAKISPEQIAEAKTLSNAIMPNGMKYEDWVSEGKPDWI